MPGPRPLSQWPRKTLTAAFIGARALRSSSITMSPVSATRSERAFWRSLSAAAMSSFDKFCWPIWRAVLAL